MKSNSNSNLLLELFTQSEKLLTYLCIWCLLFPSHSFCPHFPFSLAFKFEKLSHRFLTQSKLLFNLIGFFFCLTEQTRFLIKKLDYIFSLKSLSCRKSFKKVVFNVFFAFNPHFVVTLEVGRGFYCDDWLCFVVKQNHCWFLNCIIVAASALCRFLLFSLFFLASNSTPIVPQHGQPNCMTQKW